MPRVDRRQEALTAFRRAIEIKPRMEPAHYRLRGLLAAQSLQDDATAAYRRAAVFAPTTTLGRLARAQVLIADGEIDEAETCLRRAIRADLDDGALHWLLATLLGESCRFAEAGESFRRTVALDPSNEAAYRDLLLSKKLVEADRRYEPWLGELRELLPDAG